VSSSFFEKQLAVVQFQTRFFCTWKCRKLAMFYVWNTGNRWYTKAGIRVQFCSKKKIGVVQLAVVHFGQKRAVVQIYAPCMIFRGWIKFKIYQKLEIETLEILKIREPQRKNPGSRATLLATALTSIIFFAEKSTCIIKTTWTYKKLFSL